MNTEEVKALLKSNVCNVVFTKVDGSERKMICTLMEQHLPEIVSSNSKKSVENVIPVWDVENRGWRSFKLDKLIEINPTNFS